MSKNTVIGILVVALLAVGALLMGQRRAAMLPGSESGASLPLAAVSTDGKQVPVSADVEKIAGKLPAGSSAQKVGDMVVILAINPYPATMRQPTEFSVTLKDANGQAINDAQISLDLTMPSMWMPPNKPALNFIADGKYSATGRFTMRGWWRVEVIVARGGQTQSAFFDLGL